MGCNCGGGRRPPIRKQIKNLASSVKKVVTHAIETGEVASELDSYRKRLEICKTCEHFGTKSRCNICGCFMLVKARLASEECPKGKW